MDMLTIDDDDDSAPKSSDALRLFLDRLNIMSLGFVSKALRNQNLVNKEIGGEIPFFNTGHFEIMQTLKLPENMTKGEFFLEIGLTHPNVEFLATFPNAVKLETEGISGSTGLSFEYNGCGLLML